MHAYEDLLMTLTLHLACVMHVKKEETLLFFVFKYKVLSCCCIYYCIRNSLEALLEALLARKSILHVS